MASQSRLRGVGVTARPPARTCGRSEDAQHAYAAARRWWRPTPERFQRMEAQGAGDMAPAGLSRFTGSAAGASATGCAADRCGSRSTALQQAGRRRARGARGNFLKAGDPTRVRNAHRWRRRAAWREAWSVAPPRACYHRRGRLHVRSTERKLGISQVEQSGARGSRTPRQRPVRICARGRASARTPRRALDATVMRSRTRTGLRRRRLDIEDSRGELAAGQIGHELTGSGRWRPPARRCRQHAREAEAASEYAGRGAGGAAEVAAG